MSPEWVVVSVLQEDINDYIIPVEGGAPAGGGTGSAVGNDTANGAVSDVAETGMVFCKNCGAKLKPGSVFCGNCGVRL